MSKKSFIDSVEVKDPCTQDWEKMHGNDRVRFCSHCSKHVNNLSEMTRKEAMRLVRASDGKLCIRYIVNPSTRRPMFAEQLLQITRRTPGLAAGVMTASLSLSTAAYSQNESPKPPEQGVSRLSEKKTDAAATSKVLPETRVRQLGSISGTVADQMGAVIPGARVTILGVSAGKNETVATNGEGIYKFEDLEPGNYRIEWEAQGFQRGEKEVSVSAAEKQTSDAALGVAQIEVTVDVVADVQAMDSISGGIGYAIEYSLPLNQAVANGDTKKVRRLLRQGADVNGKDEHEKITPLFVAVEHGNLEIIKLLLDFGATVNATDDDGDSALIVAAGYSSAEVLRALINAGADVNLANTDGQTALIRAAGNNSEEKVDLLLSFGAFVNARNSDGRSAWDMTSDKEVRALLERFGAEITKEPDAPAENVQESENPPTQGATIGQTLETPEEVIPEPSPE